MKQFVIYLSMFWSQWHCVSKRGPSWDNICIYYFSFKLSCRCHIYLMCFVDYLTIDDFETSWINMQTFDNEYMFCVATLQPRQMTTETSSFTCLPIVCSAVCTEWHQKKHQNSALLALCEDNLTVTGGSPHRDPVMQSVFPFLDVILNYLQ